MIFFIHGYIDVIYISFEVFESFRDFKWYYMATMSVKNIQFMEKKP